MWCWQSTRPGLVNVMERAQMVPGKETYINAEETASKFDLWAGRTYWGMLLRDDLMYVGLSCGRGSEVDPERIGVTGMSMGATRTWWLMALDERLKAGAGNRVCLTRYQNLMMHGVLAGHDIGYFVPNMLAYFDSEAVVALIAPRPVLFQTGDQDSASPVEGIRIIESAVRPAYRLYGKGRRGVSKYHLRRRGSHLYARDVGQDVSLDGRPFGCISRSALIPPWVGDRRYVHPLTLRPRIQSQFGELHTLGALVQAPRKW